MYKTKRIFLVLTIVMAIVLSSNFFVDAAEVWHYWLSGGEKEALEALLAEAKREYPDTEFAERGIPGATTEMRRQLGTAFMAGNPPEVYQSAIGYDLKSYVDAGRLTAIDDIWKAIDGDKVFSDGLKNMVKFNGHVYGIPINTHIISHIFYNKKIFEKYNLEIPSNWDEFKQVSSVLRENGIEPFAAAGGIWALYHFYAPLVTVLSPEGYMKLGNGQIAFTDKKVREAFELYRDDFVSSYMFGWSGYGWAEAANELIDGNAAMYLNGDWVVAYFKQAGWKPGVDFDFFPAPGTQDVMIMQVDALAAPQDGKDTDGMHKLLTVAGGVNGQKAFNKYKGSVAANLEVNPDIYNVLLKKTYDRIQKINKEGVMLPNILVMLPPSLFQELQRQVEIYALNPTDEVLDKVLNTLEARRQELIKKGAFVNWQEM